MRIKELNIVEFGCIKNKKLQLCDSVNIIDGDNESGKSTVMLFIKFMLYGLAKRSAKSTDRERSLSFDGHRAAGSMTLESGGRQYRIERNAVGVTRVSETMKIIDLQSGETLEGEPWERFVGVPCEVFESSCAISQARAAELNKTSAANAIENILVSADESIDVKKVLDSIDKVRKEYKLNRGDGGILHDTETELLSLRQKYRASTERYLKINVMSERLEKRTAELEKTDADIASAKEQLAIAKDAETLMRFDELEKQRASLDELRARLASLEDSNAFGGILPTEEYSASLKSSARHLTEAKAELEARKSAALKAAERAGAGDPRIAVGEQIERAGGASAVTARANTEHKRAKTLKTVAIVLFLLAVCSAGLFALPLMLGIKIAFAALAAVLCGVGICLAVASGKARKRRDAVCSEYAQSFDALSAYLSECIACLAASRAADAERIAADSRAADAQLALDNAKTRLASTLLCHVSDANSIEPLLDSAALEIQRSTLFCQQRKQLSDRIISVQTLVDSAARSLSAYDESELRSRLGRAPYDAKTVAECERILSFNATKRESTAKEVSYIRETLAGDRASAFESPVEISDKIAALEQRLRRDTEYFDALMLAKEHVERASEDMSGSVTPQISRKAGELFALVSGGKHASVQMTKNLDLSVDEDGFNVSADLLSAGARDAAYVCLRISLMLRIFGDELPPLILDDALCQLDDTRAAALMSVLAQLCSLPLQCIVFTCHSREKRICSELGVPCSVQSMSQGE